MKSIAIIGGGIAGLTAGIYGCKAGYKTTIYEKNASAGGCLMTWKRDGYTIDNCIHWLVGTRKDSGQYKLWEEIGALREDTPLYVRDNFLKSELNGESITLWRDLKRTEAEMLALSPEDEQEIRFFIHNVLLGMSILNSMEGSGDMKNVLSGLGNVLTRAEGIKALLAHKGLTLEKLAARFRHPLLRKMVLDFSSGDYEAMWLTLSYGMFTAGDADVPIGGTEAMAGRILDTYLGLGGEIQYGKKASALLIEPGNPVPVIGNDTASGIRFEDGSEVQADYIVCACPYRYTFESLLDKKYAPAGFEKLTDVKRTPIYSSFHCAFAVDGLLEEVNDLLYFPCDILDVGCRICDRIGVKNYRSYGDYIAPEGKTVIQCSFIQYPEDCDYWIALRKNPAQYRLRKEYTVSAVLDRLEKRFPDYKGRIHPLDSWTPATYERFLGSDHGLYMRYLTTPLSTDAFLSCEVRNIKNVFLAGHTLRYPGGTPFAAASGKTAIEHIEKAERHEEKNNEDCSNV